MYEDYGPWSWLVNSRTSSPHQRRTLAMVILEERPESLKAGRAVSVMLVPSNAARIGDRYSFHGGQRAREKLWAVKDDKWMLTYWWRTRSEGASAPYSGRVCWQCWCSGGEAHDSRKFSRVYWVIKGATMLFLKQAKRIVKHVVRCKAYFQTTIYDRAE